MKHQSYVLLFVISLFPLLSNGQNVVTGKTIDTYNKVIDDVYLVNRQTDKHTHTDNKGQFVLEASVGDTFEITHIAFNTVIFVVQQSHFKAVQSIQMSDKLFELAEVLIKNDIENLNVITAISLETNPVNSSQELLRQVPGLIIGQHAGGGKSEQMFLRGFDIDHGTDIRISVDEMPVNIVSHAHGQGYADLHFLIPEIVQKVDFGKGPYYTQKGNFGTAGYVNFETKEDLAFSSVGLEYGMFNTMKIKGIFNLLENVPNHHAYIAATYRLTDGAFQSSQNFNQINLFGKYTWKTPDGNKMSIQAGYFYARWDASGQIPQRAVDQGLISRFGSIDSTEGGQTSRANVIWNYTKILSEHSLVKSSVYYSNYDFELYSNFTFFLNDSINGDQIKQFENRNLFGGQTEIQHLRNWGQAELNLKGGVGFRYDDSNNNELSRTRGRREVLSRLKLGNIDETNMSGWLDLTLKYEKLTFNLGSRLDYFKFNYVDLLDSLYKIQAVSKVVASPKLNILYNPNSELQLYFKTGIGFHSNDTRVVVAESTENTLPIAIGADLGTIWKPFGRLVVDAALWTLFSQQEMVYVGDEAIVEPSGASIRAGVDFGLHLQIAEWLYFDGSVNYVHARSLESPKGMNYIPLAVDLTSSGGLSIKHPIGISGGTRLRFVKDRPANEDNSIVAKGYAIVDLNAGYQYKRLAFGITIENLFNSNWNETQFATESRLRNETTSVEEIHFTPGMPFFIKGQIEYRF